jgi:hypothetical protein
LGYKLQRQMLNPNESKFENLTEIARAAGMTNFTSGATWKKPGLI